MAGGARRAARDPARGLASTSTAPDARHRGICSHRASAQIDQARVSSARRHAAALRHAQRDIAASRHPDVGSTSARAADLFDRGSPRGGARIRCSAALRTTMHETAAAPYTRSPLCLPAAARAGLIVPAADDPGHPRHAPVGGSARAGRPRRAQGTARRGGTCAPRAGGLRAWHTPLRASSAPRPDCARSSTGWPSRSCRNSATARCSTAPSPRGPARCARCSRATSAPVATLVVTPWGQDPSAAWRDAVRLGIAHGVRWCFCVTGPSLRSRRQPRTYSRQFVEFDLETALENEQTFAVLWGLLRPRR